MNSYCAPLSSHAHCKCGEDVHWFGQGVPGRHSGRFSGFSDVRLRLLGLTTGSLVVTAGFLRVELGPHLLRAVRGTSGGPFSDLGILGEIFQSDTLATFLSICESCWQRHRRFPKLREVHTRKKRLRRDPWGSAAPWRTCMGADTPKKSRALARGKHNDWVACVTLETNTSL